MRSPVAVAAVVLAAAAWSAAASTAPPGVDAAAYREVTRTLRCDCGCHPQSIADCACGRAGEMREEVTAQLAGGKSADEVIEAWVALRGEQIRLAPTATGFNLVAWLGPGALLALASGAVIWILRRWSPGSSASTPAPTAEPLSEEERDRLRKRLEEYS